MQGLGNAIRGIRQKAGLSQEALARELDVSLATVNRWENERATPSLGELVRLADLLGTSAAKILAAAEKVA